MTRQLTNASVCRLERLDTVVGLENMVACDYRPINSPESLLVGSVSRAARALLCPQIEGDTVPA
jgi:hypothetical protein